MANSMIETIMMQIIAVASKQGKWLVGSVYGWAIWSRLQREHKMLNINYVQELVTGDGKCIYSRLQDNMGK